MPSSNPAPLSSGQASQQEIAEKFGGLKRRYAELEQESNSGNNPSDERNVRMREEKDFLLQKMNELEQSTQNDLNMLPPPTVDPKAHPQEPVAREDPIKSPDAQKTSKAPRKTRASAAANSAQSRNPHPPDVNPLTVHPPANNGPASSSSIRAQNGDKDVEMEDGHASGYSHSRGASGVQPRREQQERDGQASEPVASSSRRETRATRQNRGLRNEGNVIAAVAAATAEAEAAATLAAAQSSGGRISSQSAGLNHSSSSTQHDARMVDTVSSPTSALAHALGVTADGSPPKDASGYNNLIQHAPYVESILKVAEAAVAAQNAAAAAAAAAASNHPPKDTSNSNIDPNLDPSLFSESSNGVASKSSNLQPLPTNKSPQVNTSAPAPNNQNPTPTSSTPTSSTTTPTPTSSLSNNPYLSLSTNLLPRVAGSSSASPNMLMPYPMFYPPGTPVTPNSPSYPMPYNPYFYLAAPMPPAQNGMYPLPPSASTTLPTPTPQQPQQSTSERPKTKPAQKAKRLKAHAVTTKSFSIPLVPRDKNKKPMLPLNVGIMTVINLGEVCMREHFHTERYIFPVGYEVTRRYSSTVDPTIEVVYHCTILDGGDGPKFQIIPSDRPDKPIIAGTATGAWSNIVKQANAIRNRQHSNSVSGPDFFGLGQNTIKHLIQELPNANRLRDYVWQNFVEGGPLGGRHAAVIPALPEEYDASMPIGPYYPKRDLSDPNLPRGMSHYPQHIIAQAEAQKVQRSTVQAQEQGLAGPSGSISAPTPLQQASSSHPPPQLATPDTSGLNIREYQPNQASQSVSQGPEKRATRSNPAAASNPSASTSSASTRSTRAAARGNQQQQQQSPLPAQQVAMPVNDPGPPPMGADGTMPTTFAGIMNMYPTPAIPGTNGTATNPTIPPG